MCRAVESCGRRRHALLVLQATQLCTLHLLAPIPPPPPPPYTCLCAADNELEALLGGVEPALVAPTRTPRSSPQHVGLRREVLMRGAGRGLLDTLADYVRGVQQGLATQGQGQGGAPACVRGRVLVVMGSCTITASDLRWAARLRAHHHSGRACIKCLRMAGKVLLCVPHT